MGRAFASRLLAFQGSLIFAEGVASAMTLLVRLSACMGGIMRIFAVAVVAGLFGAIGYKVADAVLFRGRR